LTIEGANAPKERSILPEWKRECRNNGKGIMALFITAAFAWITGAHTFIVLSNGKLQHPSWLGWPLYVCIGGILVGAYTYLAATRIRLPIPGRQFAPIDHSARHSLWFEQVHIGINVNSQAVDRVDGVVGIVFSNGHLSLPIIVHLEQIEASICGFQVQDKLSPDNMTFVLLPGHKRQVSAPPIVGIPLGVLNGEVSYSVIYGAADGVLTYRQTHKLSFATSRAITIDDIPDNLPKISFGYKDIESSVITDLR
jgi:hypothetical protein